MSKYHIEPTVSVTSGGQVKEIPRCKAAFKLKEIKHDGQTVMMASDRPYIKMPDGSLKGLKPKMTKSEKKQEKKNRKHRS